MIPKTSNLQYTPWDQWDARGYLHQYFSRVEPEEQATLEFLVQRLGTINRGGKVLQFGCGPTIAEALPAVPYASEIYMADYLPVNIQEILAWAKKDPRAFDWNRFTDLVLKLEGMPYAISDIVNREEQLRRKIKQITLCDASKFPPIPGLLQQYPTVITTFCADCATFSKKIWRKYMKNILRLVAPSGHLLLVALRNAKFYRVGGNSFPCVPIDEQDMFDALTENAYNRSNINLAIKDIPDAKNRGFNSIMLVHAIRE